MPQIPPEAPLTVVVAPQDVQCCQDRGAGGLCSRSGGGRARRICVPVEMTAVTSTGGLLPRDLLDRIAAGDPTLDGTHAETYGLARGERLNNAVTHSWNRLDTLWERFTAEEVAHDGERAGTGLTRRRFTLPLLEELGFADLRRRTTCISTAGTTRSVMSGPDRCLFTSSVPGCLSIGAHRAP